MAKQAKVESTEKVPKVKRATGFAPLKFKDFTLKNNLPKYILAVISIIAVLVLQWVAAPVILVAYVLVSLLFKNKIA